MQNIKNTDGSLNPDHPVFEVVKNLKEIDPIVGTWAETHLRLGGKVSSLRESLRKSFYAFNRLEFDV